MSGGNQIGLLSLSVNMDSYAHSNLPPPVKSLTLEGEATVNVSEGWANHG